MPRLLGSALNEAGLSHFILSSSWHIEGFLLLPKILAFRKSDCLPLLRGDCALNAKSNPFGSLPIKLGNRRGFVTKVLHRQAAIPVPYP